MQASKHISTNGHAAVKTASAAAAKTEAALSNASRDFHNVMTDVEDMIKSATALTGEDLAKAKAKVSDLVARAKESANQMTNEITSRGRAIAAETNDFAHEQPWKVVGIGALAGLIIGLLLRSGSSR